MLAKSFPALRVKALRPIVLSLLQHVAPRVSDDHLRVVLEDRELYDEVAVEVKQQIWQDNQALFGDEVSPLLSR